MILVPHTAFGRTKLLPLTIWADGILGVDGEDFDATLWVERDEDWYALMSPQLKSKRVRIVNRKDWLYADLIEQYAAMGYSWDNQ